MTFDGRTATTAVMLVLFAGASVLSLDLPSKAAFMPLLVGIPGTLMCLWQLVLDLRRDRPAQVEAGDGGKSETEIFLWLAGFSAAILGFGFLIGGSLIVAAFIRFSSRENWANAAIAGFATIAVLWAVFQWLLELSLFQGLLLERLL